MEPDPNMKYASVRPVIVNPDKIDQSLLDCMHLDTGIRTLVSKLLRHGYDTAYSCEGHDGDNAYITITKGTGDGTLEKELADLGFTKRSSGENDCCAEYLDVNFCKKCGTSTTHDYYQAQGSLSL